MAKRRRSQNGLVYSTDPDRMGSGAPDAGAAGPSDDGRVRVRRETKGRKGKTVTTIAGVPLDPFALAALAKELKQKCGSGGTVRDGVIEIQGDHVDTIVGLLSHRGWDVKRAGG